LRLRGKFNEGLTPYYKDSLPGDSPEVQPLDSHLFADIKEGVSRNVATSFLFADNDATKYSLRTPKHVFDSIERTIKSGCPSKKRIVEDINRIPHVMQLIIEAKGTYLADDDIKASRKKPTREGARGELEREEKLSNVIIDPMVQSKFDSMLADMLSGKGLPYDTFPEEASPMGIASIEDGFGPDGELSMPEISEFDADQD
jgi:hypothetical protein